MRNTPPSGPRLRGPGLLLLSIGFGCREPRSEPTPQTDSPATAVAPRPVAAIATGSATANRTSSAPPTSAGQAGCVSLTTLGAARLADDAAFRGSALAAVLAARKELERLLARPSDYHAVAEDGGDLVIVEIWPSSLLEHDACVDAARRDENSRILTYDVKKRRILATRWAGDAAPAGP